MAYSLYVYVRGFLFGAGQVVRATVWDTLSAAAALVGLALVLLADANAWLLLPLTVCYGAYAAASWPRGHGTLAPEVRREMRGFLWLSLVNSVATGGFLQLTMVAAGYWDRVDAGSFAAALSLATPASLASRSLTLVLFPSLAAAHGRGDTEGAKRQTDVATRGLVVLSLATFGPLMLISPALIDLLYRRADFESAKVLLPLLLAAVMATNLAAGAINSLLSARAPLQPAGGAGQRGGCRRGADLVGRAGARRGSARGRGRLPRGVGGRRAGAGGGHLAPRRAPVDGARRAVRPGGHRGGAGLLVAVDGRPRRARPARDGGRFRAALAGREHARPASPRARRPPPVSPSGGQDGTVPLVKSRHMAALVHPSVC